VLEQDRRSQRWIGECEAQTTEVVCGVVIDGQATAALSIAAVVGYEAPAHLVRRTLIIEQSCLHPNWRPGGNVRVPER